MGNKHKKNRLGTSKGPAGGTHIPAPKLGPPRDDSYANGDHHKPMFSFEHLGGDYCVTECTETEKASFVLRLHTLSKMTWAEIQKSHKHGLGYERIPRDRMGKRSYPEEVTDDVNMIAFRFFGKAPMVGYRKGRTFVVLFLDRDFTLYPHS